jgi:hypothetical protein
VGDPINYLCVARHKGHDTWAIFLIEGGWGFCVRGAKDGHQWLRIMPIQYRDLVTRKEPWPRAHIDAVWQESHQRAATMLSLPELQRPIADAVAAMVAVFEGSRIGDPDNVRCVQAQRSRTALDTLRREVMAHPGAATIVRLLGEPGIAKFLKALAYAWACDETGQAENNPMLFQRVAPPEMRGMTLPPAPRSVHKQRRATTHSG